MKNLLIVVDYQNDFVNGSLGFPEAVLLEDKICEKIKQYQADGQQVLFTFDTHDQNYRSTQEGTLLPVPHCVQDTHGWQLYGKVADLCAPEQQLCKPSFGSLAVAQFVTQGFDQIELVGLVSNICVISNAVIVKAAAPEAKVIVDASCTASSDQMLHEKALDVMEGLQIQVRNR